MFLFLHHSAMQTNFFSMNMMEQGFFWLVGKKSQNQRKAFQPDVRLQFSNECVIVYNVWDSFKSRERALRK